MSDKKSSAHEATSTDTTGKMKPVATTDAGTVSITRGRSTSEFGLTLGSGALAAVVAAATIAQAIPGPWAIVGAGILAGLSFLGYNIGRGVTKAAAIKSLDKK